jgi:hypothetical protein
MSLSLFLLLGLIVIPILSIAGAIILKFISRNKTKKKSILDNLFLLLEQFSDLAFAAGKSSGSTLRKVVLLVSLVCGLIGVCFVIGAIARSI